MSLNFQKQSCTKSHSFHWCQFQQHLQTKVVGLFEHWFYFKDESNFTLLDTNKKKIETKEERMKAKSRDIIKNSIMQAKRNFGKIKLQLIAFITFESVC